MPNRIIREGIIDSERVNSLSWGAEVFYRRLLSIVDDFGCFDGRISMLRTKLYPAKVDQVQMADIEKWLKECLTAKLMAKYEHDKKPYLLIFDFNQTVRIKRRKYPQPPESCYADATQMNSRCTAESNPIHTIPNPIHTESEVEVESNPTPTPSPFDKKNIENLKKEFLKNSEWLNVSCKSLGIEIKDMPDRIDKFITHLKTSSDLAKTEQDFAKHFMNWTRIQMRPKVINGKSVSGFPNGWDQSFFNSLKDGEQISKYRQHLHSLGLVAKKNHRGDVVDYIPKENAQG